VRITVVLADDHPLVLRGLQGLLSGEVDFQVVAQCANGVEALRSIQTYQPELAVVDLSMPQRDGLWVLREVHREKLRTRVVLLAASIDEHQMVEARRFGVGGVVLKDMAPRLLLQCLRKVYSGELWIEHRVAARALDMLLQREEGAREIGSILTTREVEIARLVASGLRNRCIAERLFVSEATVKTHLHNIYDKLNVESRGQLILYCTERGIGRTLAS
jgi:DNA-binding NarL/FixJ family response regulator